MISDVNKAGWNERSISWAYRNADRLYPAEEVMIAQLQAERSDWRVLDIGVGTGRTTPLLRKLGRTYVGVDYSIEMVRAAQARLPGVDIRQMDARNLSAFSDSQFDTVWFSFNGLDYVAHDDRLNILVEVHRVLAPDGVFCFSSHNRDFTGLEQTTNVQPPRLSLNPLRTALRVIRYATAKFNARRLKRCEVHASEYSLLNDDAGQHRFLTYYISVPAQIAQLRQVGFLTVRAFGKSGEEIDTATRYADDYMVHYMARN